MEWIRINKKDNVAVALADIEKNELIPKGHKFALQDIKKGEQVIKYGTPIGIATTDIVAGDLVHVHNMKTLLDHSKEYVYGKNSALQTASCEAAEGQCRKNTVENASLPCDRAADQTRYFDGYRREDGRYAVRNEIWIIATVGCVNSIADEIAEKAWEAAKGRIDGVFAIKHPYGCSQMGEDQEATLRVLTQLAMHPNAGGVLMLGLGCENCNFEKLREKFPQEYLENSDRIKWLRCQDEEDEIAEGVRLTEQLIEYASGFKRENINAGELVIGLKCGGSDGLSGITANPLLGRFTDMHCERGGSAILTEVPEMFGAEQFLMNRCKDESTFDKTVKMINEFKEYYRKNNQVIYENPSPGNKKGGITTLEDKSLGCIQKSGSTEVNDVLRYAYPVKTRGLSLLEAPGNDLVASTALAVSGAHIVLFTTGRGTPFGGVVPTVKIASNHELAMKKKNWIDFDAEKILDANGVEEKENAVLHNFDGYILEVASGKNTKSEEKGYKDIAIFKRGVTL